MAFTGDPELFSQAAFEHLKFLREYAGVLLDPYPAPQAVESLYQSAQMLAESSSQYGLPLFSQVAGKLGHIFHYALNTGISPESSAAIVEFIQEAAAVLESDLLLLSANGVETTDDIQAFQEKHPFAFQASATEVAQETREITSQDPAPGAPAQTPPSDALSESQPEPAESLPDDGEVPGDILEFFVPEVEEHLRVVTECLLALEANPSSDVVHRLFRAMHTVKGSAAQVGLQRIAHVAHRAEDLIGCLREGELSPGTEIVEICLEAVDTLRKLLYREWPDEETMQSSVASLLARIARLAPAEAEEEQAGAEQIAALEPLEEADPALEASPEEQPLDDTPFASHGTVPVEQAAVTSIELLGASPPAASVPAPSKELAASSQSKSVRVPLDRLDRMMNVVGALVTNRTRISGRLSELESLAEVLNFSKGRLIEKIGEFQERYEFTRLQAGYPGFAAQGFFPVAPVVFPASGHYADSVQAEFGELEWDRYDDFNILARSLTEISADLTEVLTQLGRFVRQVDSDMDEFSNLAHRLQDEITEARMVPIGNLYTRLSRTARDAAKATGKQVELVLEGAETELDNGVIQQISDPLIHLVRNSVAHGIETPLEREECGKPASGRVTLRAYHRGNQIYIEVEDDGRGIDYEKIRATALSLGLAPADVAARLTESELLEFLFRPGFSTASRKTELAGRGVGLDVVRANLTGLNGEISIETERTVGTRFTLKVPLTLIITQALFLRYGSRVFGIPLACVEEIRRLRASEIEEVGGKQLTLVRGQVMEVVRLDSRLGLDPMEPANGFYRMVIVNVGDRQFGLIVEEVLRKDEIVIKGLGEYLRNVKLFPGATIAPDGSLILLIDINRLVDADAPGNRFVHSRATATQDGLSPLAGGSKCPEPASVPPEKAILLADDSISVRRFVGRMLEKAGYRVKLACDGLEALEVATRGGCDLILTDLEMPRTNGYELVAHLRQSPATRSLPVIVLTSRAGAKHREKALREGASGFLSKPVQEEQLLAAVARSLGAATPNSTLAPVTGGRQP